MKILFASYLYVYPPNNGYKKSLYPIIKKVAKDHDVTILSFFGKNDEHLLGKISENTGAREINVARKKPSFWQKWKETGHIYGSLWRS